MSFWEHLDVLRGAVIRILIAVCVLSCLGLAFKEPLFRFILAPAEPDFPMYRLMGADFDMKLINVDISAQFFAHLKASVIAGLIFAFPYIVWEIWKFILPALYANEKRAVRRTFLLSSGLFYLGAAVGYFVVLPFCLQFFMNYSVSPDIANTATLRSYMSMFGSLVLLMGIAFDPVGDTAAFDARNRGPEAAQKRQEICVHRAAHRRGLHYAHRRPAVDAAARRPALSVV